MSNVDNIKCPHPHPPKPPVPPIPPTPPRFESIKTVLTKKVNNVVYELLVKTHVDQVVDDTGVTLTEKLNEIFDLLTTSKTDVEDIRAKYDEICGGAPETFDSFKEVWDYVNVNGNPKSELLKLIESKQDKEEGKGLSANDFTDILREKLENDYTKEELDEKFEIIFDKQGKIKIELENRISNLEKRMDEQDSEPNVPLVTDPLTADIDDGDMWFLVVTKDA